MRGDRLRQRREELGLTQAQLSERTGIRQFHISRIEGGGIRDVKGETLRRLALALRVSADFLLGMDDAEEQPALAAAMALP